MTLRSALLCGGLWEIGVSVNPVRDLCTFFIREILDRKMSPADYRGRHMRTASRLLKEMKYDMDAVVAALVALKERDFAQFQYDSDKLPKTIEGMEVLYLFGEPPLIERFISPPPIPPVYSQDYSAWVQRWGRTAIEREEWDGIYRQDPTELSVCGWLPSTLGLERYKESVTLWLTQQQTSQQRKRLSDT
jgi:hypothetical protein